MTFTRLLERAFNLLVTGYAKIFANHHYIKLINTACVYECIKFALEYALIFKTHDFAL